MCKSVPNTDCANKLLCAFLSSRFLPFGLPRSAFGFLFCGLLLPELCELPVGKACRDQSRRKKAGLQGPGPNWQKQNARQLAPCMYLLSLAPAKISQGTILAYLTYPAHCRLHSDLLAGPCTPFRLRRAMPPGVLPFSAIFRLRIDYTGQISRCQPPLRKLLFLGKCRGFAFP